MQVMSIEDLEKAVVGLPPDQYAQFRAWFEEFEAKLPGECPTCGGAMLHRCPACAAPFSSTFAVECEECGAKLREPELFGVPIRKNA